MGTSEEQIPVSEDTVAFARSMVPVLVPRVRTAGFVGKDWRGSGDLLDLVGSIVVFRELAARGCVCSLNITAGCGDASDIDISIPGVPEMTHWNVKTSRYAPYRDGLNLIIKEEELLKPMYGFIQCFVHLDEPPSAPHVHIAGFDLRKRLEPLSLVEIPNTGGHIGVMRPVEALACFERLLNGATKRDFTVLQSHFTHKFIPV